jgi:hypothetical protein
VPRVARSSGKGIPSRGVLVSESPLNTHAGPIAVIAGGLFAVAHLGQVRGQGPQQSRDDDAEPGVSAVRRRVRHHLPADPNCVGSAVLTGGPGGGTVRSGAFCIAVTGTVALAGDMWFEGFDSPWIAQSLRRFFSADRTGSSLVKAWLVTVVLFALEWALFDLASWRARVIPVASSITLGRRRPIRVHGRHASLGVPPRAGRSGARRLANPTRPDSWYRAASRDNATLNHRNHRCGATSRLVEALPWLRRWVAYPSTVPNGDKTIAAEISRCPIPTRPPALSTNHAANQRSARSDPTRDRAESGTVTGRQPDGGTGETRPAVRGSAS